jgi:hypothetical protein
MCVAGLRAIRLGGPDRTRLLYLAAMVITFALLYVAAGLVLIGMRVLVNVARGLVRRVRQQ